VPSSPFRGSLALLLAVLAGAAGCAGWSSGEDTQGEEPTAAAPAEGVDGGEDTDDPTADTDGTDDPATDADAADPDAADPDAADPDAADPDAADPEGAGADEAEVTLPAVPLLHPSVDDYPEGWVTVARSQGGDLVVPVKVADTAELRQHGLMEVPELPDGTGMLFLFEEERTGGFWMKDTLVPLDIAFVDATGEVVAILAMDPCEADPCETYAPGAPYRSALEVPQGWFAANDIDVGDRIDHEPDDGGD
jgi:uncharacterized protein